MRDFVEEVAAIQELSSQEAETLQDWLFLSSSQLDHLESASDCEGEEDGQLNEQKMEGPRTELGE